MRWTIDEESEAARIPPPPPPPPPPLPPPELSTSPRGLLPPLPSTIRSSATIGQRKSSQEESIGNPVSFAEKSGATALHNLRDMGLTRAMRALDTLRKHTPTKEEIDELGASERLDIQDCAGLLILCGCKRGGRLTHDEMKTVHRVTLDMANVYSRLEALFYILIPRTERKAPTAAGGSETNCDLERFFELANEWLGVYEEARELALNKRAELSRSCSAVDRGKKVGTPVTVEDTSHGDAEGIEAKHSLLFPVWLSILVDLYQTAQEECRVPSTERDSGGGNRPPAEVERSSVAAGNVYASDTSWGTMTDKDFRSIREKCVRQHERNEQQEDRKRAERTLPARQMRPTDVTESSSDPRREITRKSSRSVDSLVSFSQFLALLVAAPRGEHLLSGCGVGWTTPREVEALEELMMASDDGSDQRGITLANNPPREGSSIIAAASSGGVVRDDSSRLHPSSEALSSSVIGASRVTTHPVRYWALRIHRFLLSVRELKAVPDRDEDKLSRGFCIRGTDVVDEESRA